MKRTIILAAFLLGLIPTVEAQESDEKWSRRECIEWAIDFNISIEQQELTVESSEIDLNTSRNSRLPSLSASASENFNFGRSPNMATGVYEANQSAGTSVGVSSSMTLFSGFRIANQIKVGELNLRAAIENLNKAKENLELTVASYYLDVLFKKELLKVAEEQAALTEQKVGQTEVMVHEGKVPESQLYDIRSQLAQNQVSVTNAKNNLDASLLTLAQALNLPSNLPDGSVFDIQEPDADNLMGRNTLSGFSPEDIYDLAIGLKPQVKEAEYRLESSWINVKIAKSSRYPSISLGMSYNSGYSHIFNHDQPIDPFMDQIRNNQRQAIGISLNIPIFNRLQTRNQIRSAVANVLSHSLELDNVKQALYKEIQQAYQSALAAQARYLSTETAYEAAQIAFEAAQVRYEVGKSTVYEFNEAQSRLAASRSEQIQAKYDYVFRAKILDFYRGEPIDIR
jgi:outer membrane protein